MQGWLKRLGMAGATLGVVWIGTAPVLAAHHHRSSYRHYHARADAYPGRGDVGAYAWAPRGYDVRGWYNSGDVNERLCMLSPASIDYQPCMNRW